MLSDRTSYLKNNFTNGVQNLTKLLAENQSKRPPQTPQTKPATPSTITVKCGDSSFKAEPSMKPCVVKDGKANNFGNKYICCVTLYGIEFLNNSRPYLLD